MTLQTALGRHFDNGRAPEAVFLHTRERPYEIAIIVSEIEGHNRPFSQKSRRISLSLPNTFTRLPREVLISIALSDVEFKVSIKVGKTFHSPVMVTVPKPLLPSYEYPYTMQ